MVVMARTEDTDGKIQGNSLPEVRAGLKQATIRLSPHFPRPGRRPLEYGLILSRIAAWFLIQSHEKQLEITSEGNRIIEELGEIFPGPVVLDDALAAEIRRRLGYAEEDGETTAGDE